MYSIVMPSQIDRKSAGDDALPQKPQLSPGNRYYICRLLQQPLSYESPELLKFTARLTEDNCSNLNAHLLNLYPDLTELATVILKLENLVYFYQSVNAQILIYPEYAELLQRFKQEIFRLLGFPGILDS